MKRKKIATSCERSPKFNIFLINVMNQYDALSNAESHELKLLLIFNLNSFEKYLF